MPALENPKHERFAQALAKGKTSDEAYVLADLERVLCDKPAGFYVYALIDPRNDRVFYIGKGKGKRHSAHYREFIAGSVTNSAKFNRIAEIACSGLRPEAVCLADGLEEWPAYSLERALIKMIGKATLTNSRPGQMSDLEKSAVMARHGLSKIMPFDRWMAKKRNSGSWIVSPEYDTDLYWSIVRDFSAMAQMSHASPF